MMAQKDMTGRKAGVGAKTMRKLLCLIMALLLAFGTASFADEAETDSLEMILSGMTLRD